jgi:hypothetical protein
LARANPEMTVKSENERNAEEPKEDMEATPNEGS